MFFSFLLLLFVKGNIGQENKYTEFGNYSTKDWSTCEEFLANTTFDHKKLVDIDWKIFFFWSFHKEESYNIRFSVPTATLIDRFKVELDDEIAPPVNWSNADLFMETSIDFSGLFIRSKVSGIYTLVPSLAFQYPNIPLFKFGLKYVEPGYFGLMNCRQQLCYALAPVDKLPPEDMIEEEAKKLGFRGKYFRSHLDAESTSTIVPQPDRIEFDDDDEDEHFEIERDPNNMQML